MSALDQAKMDDGCAIAFEYWQRAGAATIVLSPSLGTASALFDPQVEALAQRFSVLRYDPRGHGQSDVPSGSYSLDRLGHDVIQLLDAVGVESAHFVGVSLGGMTGQWLGYRAPDRLLSLTLANTSAYMGPPSAWADRIGAVLEGGMAAMVAPVIERWFTPQFRAEQADTVELIADLLKRTDARGYAACCAAIRDMDLRRTASLISIPTLVIGGAQDPATPLAHAQFLADNIQGARLAVLDAAHLSNVEQARTFNATLIEFLEVS